MNTKKTSQPETAYTSKQRRNRLWLTRFAILIVLGFVLYFGYCWGLWGRHSLLLQYLFQCSCPLASTEARYPEDVDVIVPACRQSYVELSPSGRYLQVLEEISGQTSSYYLLDLQTMGRIDVTDQPFATLLTDDIGFIKSKNHLVDRTTGVQYPIKKFVYSRPGAEINGETNLALLAESLRQAELVFFIDDSADTVVALTSDLYLYSERNFTTSRFDLPDFNMERFLQKNNIPYKTILPDFPDGAASQDGRFIAHPDGIYLVETGKKIVEGYSVSRWWYNQEYFRVRGWIYDGSGVIYKRFLNPCLIETNFFFFDDYGCFIEVPQPVLKLKVPKEYLLSPQIP